MNTRSCYRSHLKSLISNKGMNMFRKSLLATSVTLATIAALTSHHSVAQGEQVILEETISLGTRSKTGRTLNDSPVPVDLINADDMASTGATEVGRMLQSLAPSFNFSSSTISDGTDALRPATLRGLGPDQTLVLVNGKRRHNSALIHVNTSVGRGTAGTDMNAIPVASIKRIEVLRDGAAAQYGSDAIAGVINIVLKDDDQQGSVHGSIGEYTEGDGQTFVLSANKGFEVGDGYFNLSAEYRDRGRTNRAGLTGVCQYTTPCTDNGDGTVTATDPREASFNRQNFRIGDADSTQQSIVMNYGNDIGTDMQVYSFLTWTSRENTSGGFYRRANQADRNPVEDAFGNPVNGGEAFYPDGYLPLINTDIEDFSIGAGLAGEMGDWTWDLGLTQGMNDFAFNISNSVNASLVSAEGDSPTSAFAGELGLTLTTLDLSAARDTDWGLLAWGVGYKRDGYSIDAGEEVSYEDYDTDVNGDPIGINDAAGGIQVFPGFKPSNEVDESRNAWYLYVDSEFEMSDALMLSAAARFEDYSDFGNTANVKGSFSFRPNDVFTLRGAVSTGFRAPSMQQLYFNNVSTQFNSSGEAEEVGTFRNDSNIAQALGIPTLKEETSVNSSIGMIFEPNDDWTITADFYNIDIEDRIVISGRITETGGVVPSVDQAFQTNGVAAAQFFLNAADTNTQGVDLVITNENELDNGASLDFTLAANFTETEVDNIKSPESLSSVPGIQDLIFTEQDQSILEEWQPKDRINFTTQYELDAFEITFSLNRYGEYTVLDGERQTFSAKTLADLQFIWHLTDNLDWNIGGNNIFDEVPDKNEVGQSRAGTILDPEGNIIVETEGVFQYSRRSAPFGFNGAYFYTGLTWSF